MEAISGEEAVVFARNLVVSVAILLGSAAAPVAVAQQQATSQPAIVNRPYDGIQAGLDAFRLGEEQRQANVGSQLFLNDQMRFWNGYPTSGSAIYYGYLSPGAMLTYGYYQPARQPIGQVQTQTGPNRWESHPIYNPPLTAYQPLPPVDSPLLDRTPYATPNGVSAGGEVTVPGPPVVAPPVRRGPREY